MKLIIKKEYTGLNNYMDLGNCPIACALKAAGYTDVVVGGRTWDGISPTGKVVSWKKYDSKWDKKAEIWAETKQEKDITIKF